jgi:hypothetical protein
MGNCFSIINFINQENNSNNNDNIKLKEEWFKSIGIIEK